MTDLEEVPERDAADCPACQGTGNVPRLQGDDRVLDRCQNCFGTGRELTRDEMLVMCDGTCDDDQCPDCHPDCPKCEGKGFIGWGHTCDDCKGMGSLYWSQSDIDNEMERRGMDAERRAMEGPSFGDRYTDLQREAQRLK